MPRKSKAAKLAEAVAAEAQAEPKPFVQQDPYVSPIGRDASGHFPKGNAGGPGNPHARHCANMLTLFRSCIDAQRLEALIKVLYDKAYAGDLGAIKLIVSYSIGKPTHAPQPDGIEHDEWKRFQQTAVRQQAVTDLLSTLPSNVVNDIVRTTWPAAATTWAENLGRQLQGQDSPGVEEPVVGREEKNTQTVFDAPEAYEAQVQEFEAALANLQNASPIPNGVSAASADPAPSKRSSSRVASTKPIANGSAKKKEASPATPLPPRNLPPTLSAKAEPIPNGKTVPVTDKKQKTRRRWIEDVAKQISK
ncbi:hypothetical protein BH10PLA2_BH10PLA2_17070 [soil metagenome]